MAKTLFARQIGARSHSTILDPDRSWSVLASVSGAIYIQSDAGDILWIAASLSALHQRAILVPNLPPDLPVAGIRCSIDDDCLHVGAEMTVRISGASVWLPDPFGQKGTRGVESPRRIADAIGRAALRSTPRGMFAGTVFPTVADDFRSSRETMGVELATVGRRAFASLYRMPFGCDLAQRLHEATGLVGLGEGLTPSGDDLLGGFLFTFRVLDSTLQDLEGIDWQHVEAWLRRVKARTNKISFSVLADHAHGEAAAPISALFCSALEGSPDARLVEHVGRVAEIGHSSGWDMLAGVNCACSAVARMLEHRFSSQCVAAGRDEVSGRSQCWKEVAHVC